MAYLVAMFRPILLVLLALLLPSASGLANEHLIVSGGPALRYFEKHKTSTHDRYWGNFIDSATARIKEIQPALPSGERITWLIFKPGYITRGKEEGIDLVASVTSRAQALGVKLVWFHNREELITYLNNDRREGNHVARFEYFGHSNKRNFMFDYSNGLDGGARGDWTLHIKHLSQINRSIFTDDAYCKSWGCHSGEEYSGAFFRRTGQRMYGAIGKTAYYSGGIPTLSTPGGKWVK